MIAVRLVNGNTCHAASRSLGVSKQSTDDEIKRSYRKLALKYHPDKACAWAWASLPYAPRTSMSPMLHALPVHSPMHAGVCLAMRFRTAKPT